MTRIFLSLILLLSGCAHRWYYTPEIKGVGEMHGGNGDIIYRIPPEGEPSLAMAVRSLGIKKRNRVAMLGIRMTFSRSKGAKPLAASLDAGKQILLLGDTPIKATFVRSNGRKGTTVDLSAEHAVVELLYPLPKGSEGADGIERYQFRWAVAYDANRTDSQTTQFDRGDSAPQQAGSMFPDDPFYPYDRAWIFAPGWLIDDPLWWTMGPW